MSARTLAEVVAELRNVITPIMFLPDACDTAGADDSVNAEALRDADESRPRIRSLLNELSAMATHIQKASETYPNAFALIMQGAP